jgi:Tfp pilus assembly protein PilX
MRIDSRKSLTNRANRRAPARGIALVYTLLILMLLMVLSLGMVIALSSQTFIGGYYRNFRGAFYAADSGVNTVRQFMVNSITSAVPGTITIGSTPLLASGASAIATNANSTYGSWTSINNGQGANSWPGQFELNSSNPPTLVQTACTLNWTPATGYGGGPFTCTSLPTSLCGSGVVTNCATINSFVYTYTYSVDVYGNVKGAQQQSDLIDNGNINVTINISPPTGVTTTRSFADYGMFIDQNPPCSVGSSMSSYLAYGEVTGPMFTNGSWNFGNAQGGSYSFPGNVSQAGASAMYGAGSSAPGTCTAETAASAIRSATFGGSLNLSQTAVPLPQNSYSQLEAVLDGLGCANSPGAQSCSANGKAISITGYGGVGGSADSALNASLRDANGAAYPIGGAPAGVYLPYSGAPGSYVFNGGGIYVEGNASITIAPGSNSTAQIYTVSAPSSSTTTNSTIPGTTTNGASCSKKNGVTTCQPVPTSTTVTTATTYTITIDPKAGPSGTTIFSGTTATSSSYSINGGSPTVTNTSPSAGSQTITGVPDEFNPATNAVTTPATMIYVDGNITSLSGPSNGLAIQNGTELTITALNNITITGSIQYVTPVVYGPPAAPASGSNADSLISGNDHSQVLGLFTATGNINLNVSGGNLEVDASIATISNGGSGAIVNTGGAISQLTVVGGRIQNTIQDINSTTRNVWFDQRFATGFAPPWFPSSTFTSVPSGVENATAVTPIISRVQWLCRSCQ